MEVIFEISTNPDTGAQDCSQIGSSPDDKKLEDNGDLTQVLGTYKTMVRTHNPSMPRLGLCQQCEKKEAVYTCPRCSERTCSLGCVRSHKKTNGCDGMRDKTAYKSVSEFTDLDLSSDYRLLEEVGRSVDAYHRDKTKAVTRQGKELPHHLYKLRIAASKRGTRLHFLPQNFSKHRANTTILNFKTDVIQWRVLWKFPQADVEYVDEKILETTVISDALEKYLEPGKAEEEISLRLQFYQAAGYTGISLFLPIEWEQGQSGNYDELDKSATLQENFKGKTVTEFPTIYVVLQDHVHMYPLRKDVTSEEVVAKKAKMTYYEASEGEISDSETEESPSIKTEPKAPDQKPKASSSWSIPDYNTL